MHAKTFVGALAAVAGLALSGCMSDAVVRTHLDEPPRPMGCRFDVRADMPVEAYDDVATVVAHVAAPTDPAIRDAVSGAVCQHGGDLFVVTDDENGTVRGEVVKIRSSPI